MLEQPFRRLYLHAAPAIRPARAAILPSLSSYRSRRWYSIEPEQNPLKLEELDPSKLQITRTTTAKELVPPQDLVFGRTFSGMPTYLLLFQLLHQSKPLLFKMLHALTSP